LFDTKEVSNYQTRALVIITKEDKKTKEVGTRDIVFALEVNCVLETEDCTLLSRIGLWYQNQYGQR